MLARWLPFLFKVKIITMRLISTFLYAITFFVLSSCDKNDLPITPDNYSSTYDVFIKNAPKKLIYTISGTTGGNFTTPQGTVVTIPPNCFISPTGTPITSNINIEFIDIYKKRDMLFADKQTTLISGELLKSGGEFFIRALYNDSSLSIAVGKNIKVEQPAALTGGIDPANPMQPFFQFPPNPYMPVINAWTPLTGNDTVNTLANYYIFSLYNFASPADSGTWCNSDNSSYFTGISQTTFTAIPNDSISVYGTQAFLLFKNISSMVHIYDWQSKFEYSFAPIGLECSFVAVGVKDGELYSSFIPTTLTNNHSLNFSLLKTTTQEFKARLDSLH